MLIHISQYKSSQNSRIWCIIEGSAKTHILVRAEQKPMVDVALHQAGLPHALLPQHHHLGIHSHGTHGARVGKRDELDRDWALHDGKTRWTTQTQAFTVREANTDGLKTVCTHSGWVHSLNPSVVQTHSSNLHFLLFSLLTSYGIWQSSSNCTKTEICLQNVKK